MTPTVIPAIFRAKDEMSKTMARMQSNVSRFATTTVEKFNNAGKAAFAVGRQAAITGALIAAPMVLAAKSAVAFEDKMSDVAKTTGFQGKELRDFGDSILEMSTKTRTSIDDLATIAEIGGQLGIAKKDMLGFVDSSNKFNVALGKDFQGGVEEAITSVGKMKSLFADTKDLNISESIMRTGSAINQLGAQGAATSANISDFALRLGALPGSMKPTAQNTLALGAFFEEMGVNAQIASGGMTDLLLHAGKQIGSFAGQMKMSAKSAKQLLMEDPTEFSKRFAESFKGMSPEKLSSRLNDFKIGSQETIKVIGALGANTERLTDLQKISADSFKENTSLVNEYNTKNNNTAAQLGKLRNNVQALGITLGNALLPVINDVVSAITPYLQGASQWIRNNKGLATTIVKVALGASALAFAISGISFAIGIYQKGMVIMNVLQGGFTKALNFTKGALVANKLATIQLNGAMLLTPTGMLVAGLTAVAVASYAVYNAFNKQTDAQRVNSEVTARAMENTVDQRIEVSKLFGVLRSVNVESDLYKNTLKRIDEIQPGLIQKYDLQYKTLRDLAGAEKELTRSIINRHRAEARESLLGEKAKQFEQNKLEGPSLLNKAVNFLGFSSAFDDEQNQLISDMKILKKKVVNDQIKLATSGENTSTTSETPASKPTQRIDLWINGQNQGALSNLFGKKVNAEPQMLMPVMGTSR